MSACAWRSLPLALLLTLAASTAAAKPTPLLDAPGCAGAVSTCRGMGGAPGAAPEDVFRLDPAPSFRLGPMRAPLLAVTDTAGLEFHLASLTADALPHRHLRGPAGGAEAATWSDWPGFGAVAVQALSWRAAAASDQDAASWLLVAESALSLESPLPPEPPLPLELLLGLSGLVLVALLRGLAASG
jgi:hypothetical protein